MSGKDSIGRLSLSHANGILHAVAVMDKIGGWEVGKEEEKQTGARFGASRAANFVTATRCRKLHVQIKFEFRGSQQDLGLSVDTTPQRAHSTYATWSSRFTARIVLVSFSK